MKKQIFMLTLLLAGTVQLQGLSPLRSNKTTTTVQQSSPFIATISQVVLGTPWSQVEPQLAKMLKTNDKLVNTKDPSSNTTPLYMAAAWGNIPLAIFLLENGASTELTSLSNPSITPIDRAAQLGFIDMVLLLVLSGARVTQKIKTNVSTAISANQKSLAKTPAQFKSTVQTTIENLKIIQAILNYVMPDNK